MIIIDKAVWQIDGGVPEELVVNHFKTVFLWLEKHDMLSDEGKEELEDGIDDCASLNEELVTKAGIEFLEACYDDYLKVVAKDKYGTDYNGSELEKIYAQYKANKKQYVIRRCKIAKQPRKSFTAFSSKEIYNNPKTGKQLVYDTDGNYFRIEYTTLTGKRVYTDINGNQIPNN